MDIENIIYISLGLLFFVLLIIIVNYRRNPFVFPYKIIEFDISSKRQPDTLDYIDRYLIENGKEEIDNALFSLKKWEKTCEEQIKKCVFKKHRRKQFLDCFDEKHLYRFNFYRIQTRYKSYFLISFTTCANFAQVEFSAQNSAPSWGTIHFSYPS